MLSPRYFACGERVIGMNTFAVAGENRADGSIGSARTERTFDLNSGHETERDSVTPDRKALRIGAHPLGAVPSCLLVYLSMLLRVERWT